MPRRARAHASSEELVTLSSLPLQAVETDFAVDASGFSTSRFVRWFDAKYGERSMRGGVIPPREDSPTGTSAAPSWCMTTASAAASEKRRTETMARYVERSREGAKRVAGNPGVWRRLRQPDTSERLTRDQFAQRFRA